MSTTDVSILSSDKEAAIAAMLGASQEEANSDDNSAEYLPVLKLNWEDEDDDGNELRKGTFYIQGKGEAVYAKSVKIRPLSNMFQWLDYDVEEQKVVNRTIVVNSLRQEAPDERGTVRCGKPTSKVLQADPALKEKYKSITCFRNVHCLVSYEGKTAKGTKTVVENAPAVLRLKGANFMPFDEEVVKALPHNGKLYNFSCDVTTERKKNGGVTYFVMHFKPDIANPLALDEPTVDTIGHILKMIEGENKAIMDKHKGSLMNRQTDDVALSAIEAELVSDLEDVPF
jgi:hypothetical protein